ncbi:MAG: DUF494 family protein [Bacillota bacterium]
MDKNLIEIISFLIKKILDDEDVFLNQDEIIEELEYLGYDIEDIDEAFSFVFDNSVLFDDSDFYFDNNMQSGYNRAFTETEKMYFNSMAKGIIFKLNNLKILPPDEFEMLITKMMQSAVFGFLETDRIWQIINEVVEEPERLIYIADNISEFKDGKLNYQIVN